VFLLRFAVQVSNTHCVDVLTWIKAAETDEVPQSIVISEKHVGSKQPMILLGPKPECAAKKKAHSAPRWKGLGLEKRCICRGGSSGAPRVDHVLLMGVCMFEHAHCMRQINPAKDRAPLSVRSTWKKKMPDASAGQQENPARGEQGGICANNVWSCSIPMRLENRAGRCSDA